MLNKVIIIGKVVNDPELRYTPSGEPVLNLRIASVRSYYNKTTNETKDDTCFITVVIWGKRADNCRVYLKKGNPVFVEGRLQSRSYEKQGIKISTIEIVAEDIQFMNRTEEGTTQEE